MNKEQIRISAKNLGSLALPDCCKKCFYIKLKLKNKLPPWFSEFGDYEMPIKVPGWNKFFYIDEETNVKLTGIPDEVLKKKDGSYAIIDYKTARFTKYADSLHPIYKVQLNGYAMIAEHIGISPISQLVLLYYEPMTDIIEITTDQLNELVKDDSFMMGFKTHSLNVDLDPERIVRPLLKEVRAMIDRGVVSQGNDDCQDCKRIEEVMELIGRIE